ncbi:uncharacterized protein TRAVEDRAFT_54540 [Trametes versicolor FP-101664 SS1]|uniref:Uncharacterized protein n=1 Tax=Trametes versicolor (strain FP-101664) TaxID=717944 RepID=R7S6E4_TRAVS|nr:uncharacterized protein TRAVEDRAFT_54540 [Trametes versicolor FP-101664 SS1]EIW51451.1 hypothetical protein TRAVEDRAFT_54540 [Trametes versicolor FP-101664 SS1]
MSTHTTAPPPMYDAEGDGADIYLRIDSTSASTMPDEHDNSEPIPFVVMLIYGPTNALMLLFPTDECTKVTQAQIEAWLHFTHGPFLTQCGASDEQLESLVAIILMYRVFALGHPGVDRDDFYLFAARPVLAAHELHPLERADDKLAKLVGWLNVNLPASVFDANAHNISGTHTSPGSAPGPSNADSASASSATGPASSGSARGGDAPRSLTAAIRALHLADELQFARSFDNDASSDDGEGATGGFGKGSDSKLYSTDNGSIPSLVSVGSRSDCP